MKSRPIGAGQNILASQNNDKRDDARGGSFLLAHQQLGALALGTMPTNGQTVSFVINGTTITATAVTSIGSTANNVLIGGSALAFVTNLINWARRPDLTTSTQIAASAANQTLLSYVGWAWPGASTNIIPFSLNKNVNGNSNVLTSFNITTTVTSGTWTAQTMQLYVEDGTYFINGTRYLFTGGSTPTVTAPVSHPRIDVLTINSSGTLAWTMGTEASSPVAPAYPANQVPICELYNIVGETALYDNENQQSSQGYIYNDVRPTLQYGIPFSAVPSDILPDTTNTRSLGSSGDEWLNIYGENIYANGNPVAGAKFGGTGADGALSISSGTTTINCGGNAIVVKNYTSISITGTGQLNFSNTNANGTIVILKSQGNITITSSATPAIDLRGVGANGGSGSTGINNNTTASAGSNGNDGNDYGLTSITSGRYGMGGGTASLTQKFGGPGGGGASATTAGTAGGTPTAGNTGGATGTAQAGIMLQLIQNPTYTKMVYLSVGAGGGGGAGGATGSTSGSSSAGASGGTVSTPTGSTSSAVSTSGSGAGAATGGGGGGGGGGALYIESVGALNFTGTINAGGSNGGGSGNAQITSGSSTNTSSGGAGGAGAGGTVIILYNSLTANTGTITVSGGTGGSAGTATGASGGSTGNSPGASGGNGGNGFSLVAQNTSFA